MNSITGPLVYWVTRLDGIKGALFALLLLCVVVIILAVLVAAGDYGMKKEDSVFPQALKWFRNGICAFLVVTILYVLTPTTNEMAAIVVLPQIVQSKVVQQEVPELYELALKSVRKVASTPTEEKVE